MPSSTLDRAGSFYLMVMYPLDVLPLKAGPERWGMAAVRRFGERKGATALRRLLSTLLDGRSLVRWQAMESLGSIGDPSGLLPLVASARHLGLNLDGHRAYKAVDQILDALRRRDDAWAVTQLTEAAGHERLELPGIRDTTTMAARAHVAGRRETRIINGKSRWSITARTAA